jgi:DNA-binding CsgD family transcriptional regulator
MNQRLNTHDSVLVTEIAALADLMTRWTECLHGAGCLKDTLARIAQVSGAMVLHLHRECLDTGRQRTVASIDRGASQGTRPLVRALGASLIDADPTNVIPGTLWTLGEMNPKRQEQLEPRVLRWMEDRRLREAAVIPLGLSENRLDIMEFFTVAPNSSRLATVALLAQMMATGWGRRNESQIVQLLDADRAIEAGVRQSADAENPLALSNPWGLTAAETRICALIKAGIDFGDIGQHLSVSASTVRSHLRSIYAKGQVSGQVELLRRLVMNGLRIESGAARQFAVRQIAKPRSRISVASRPTTARPCL